MKKEKEQKDINILIGRKKIEWVAFNFIKTEHTDIRLIQRDVYVERNLKDDILNSPLAWKNLNGTITIALNLYDYIVVDVSDTTPVIITFATTKDFGGTVIDKMFMEYKKFIAESRGD